MRLRNKKTGEIAVIAINTNHNRFTVIGKKGYLYDSLAELNEVWEDYREPKEYWYIVDNDIESDTDDGVDIDKERKAIGNYFETEEEAELAMKKLKAWKLLKDECNIEFDGIIRDKNAKLKAVKLIYDRHPVTIERMHECMDALHLLFGGEE